MAAICAQADSSGPSRKSSASVVGVQDSVTRPRASTAAIKPAAASTSTSSAVTSSSVPIALAEPAEFADAQPTGLQRRRRVLADRFQQPAEAVHGGQGLAAAGAVDGADPVLPNGVLRRGHPDRPEWFVAAQRHPDLAGQFDGLGVDPAQQARP